MAKKPVWHELSKGIKRTQAHLRAARRRASAKERKTINLQLKKLDKLHKSAKGRPVGLVPFFLL